MCSSRQYPGPFLTATPDGKDLFYGGSMENFHVPSPPLTEGIPTMGGVGWNYALCKKPSGQPPTHFIIFIISFHKNCTLEIDVQPQLRDNKNTGTHVKKKKNMCTTNKLFCTICCLFTFPLDLCSLIFSLKLSDIVNY